MDWLPAPHLEQKINIRISVVGGFRGGGGGGVAIAFIVTKCWPKEATSSHT